MIVIFKALFLFIGIWFTLINGVRLYGENDISASNLFVQAFGVSGFVFLQWVI